jgi:ribonuclease HI
MTQVEIYTDGACRGNPGPGGWAALLVAGKDRKEVSGAEPATTNNRMELKAVIGALSALKRRCAVKLYTDSKYVLQGYTEWLAAQDIEWHWVKGHSGHEQNEYVDQLANLAIDQLLAGR